jgi:hypothetical protein
VRPKPKDLAARMAARHGKLGAIRHTHALADRYRTLGPDGEVAVTHPFRWLYWTMVLANLLGCSHRECLDSIRRHRPTLTLRSAA